MKLSDIINYDYSYWNVLGQTGGTALPDNDKPKEVNGVKVWKKSPPFRIKDKRLNEVQRGADYDFEGTADIKKGSGQTKDAKYGWTNPPKGGEALMSRGKGGKLHKQFVTKSGENSAEVVDDEGNRKIITGKGAVNKTTNYARMHTGGRRSSGGRLSEALCIREVQTGTGLGGTGATVPPASGPTELEYPLEKTKDFKKANKVREDEKTSKETRETLKQFLIKRSNNATS